MNKIHRIALTHAASLLKDPARLQNFLKESSEKAETHRRVGQGLLFQLRSLYRLVRAWTNGNYRQVPRKSVLAAVGALLYFLNPMDLIPDFILVGGLLDDAAVVGMVLASLKSDCIASNSGKNRARLLLQKLLRTQHDVFRLRFALHLQGIDPCRQDHAEARSLAGLAFHPNRTLVHLDKLPGQREAESGSLVVAGEGGIDLLEHVEDRV